MKPELPWKPRAKFKQRVEYSESPITQQFPIDPLVSQQEEDSAEVSTEN
jgi:hypothetical protein